HLRCIEDFLQASVLPFVAAPARQQVAPPAARPAASWQTPTGRSARRCSSASPTSPSNTSAGASATLRAAWPTGWRRLCKRRPPLRPDWAKAPAAAAAPRASRRPVRLRRPGRRRRCKRPQPAALAPPGLRQRPAVCSVALNSPTSALDRLADDAGCRRVVALVGAACDVTGAAEPLAAAAALASAVPAAACCVWDLASAGAGAAGALASIGALGRGAAGAGPPAGCGGSAGLLVATAGGRLREFVEGLELRRKLRMSWAWEVLQPMKSLVLLGSRRQAASRSSPSLYVQRSSRGRLLHHGFVPRCSATSTEFSAACGLCGAAATWLRNVWQLQFELFLRPSRGPEYELEPDSGAWRHRDFLTDSAVQPSGLLLSLSTRRWMSAGSSMNHPTVEGLDTMARRAEIVLLSAEERIMKVGESENCLMMRGFSTLSDRPAGGGGGYQPLIEYGFSQDEHSCRWFLLPFEAAPPPWRKRKLRLKVQATGTCMSQQQRKAQLVSRVPAVISGPTARRRQRLRLSLAQLEQQQLSQEASDTTWMKQFAIHFALQSLHRLGYSRSLDILPDCLLTGYGDSLISVAKQPLLGRIAAAVSAAEAAPARARRHQTIGVSGDSGGSDLLTKTTATDDRRQAASDNFGAAEAGMKAKKRMKILELSGAALPSEAACSHSALQLLEECMETECAGGESLR
uniref:RING-type domain-containing protein n=1 Tax=Macrostomum lignano TaxID=282301 RepID=A0A1I8F844_9PLAT